MPEKYLYSATKDEEEKSEGIHIQYHKALMSKRIFSKIVDFLLAFLFGLLFFLMMRGILSSTSFYQEKKNYVDYVMLNSGLYIEKDGERYDVVSYYKNQDTSAKEKMVTYQDIITTFISFVKEDNEENAPTVQKSYDEYRLGLSKDDVKLFVEKDGEIIFNPDYTGSDVYQTYIDTCYEPYIDNQCRSYLLSLFPKYMDCNRFLSNMIVFVELPVAVILASLLVFLLPPMILRRNRQTIGMLIYHIGKADGSLLAIKTGKFLLYELTYILGIILLSFFTLGVPLFVSATMMIFTKGKQTFPEYMFQLYDLDISRDKIYYSITEIAMEHEKEMDVGQNFVPENRLDK
jgi:hypothetical protein